MHLIPIKMNRLLKSKKKLFLIVCMILVLGSTTGCLSNLVDHLTVTDWTWPSIHTEKTSDSQTDQNQTNQTQTDYLPPSSTAYQTIQTSNPEEPTTIGSERILIDFSGETSDFDEMVEQVIRTGLDRLERTISLDRVAAVYLIRENQIEAAIDRIFSVYTKIYLQNPQYFYLNGSFELVYSVMKGEVNRLDTISIEPTFWSSTQDLSTDTLKDMITAVEQVVQERVLQIRQQTDDPVKQLVLLHDWLIETIAYDVTGNQATNHAGSALLDHVTLCQGYAQSFQMIGQSLGIDVRMITGQSGGIGHAWNQVLIDQIAYHVDVTHDDPIPDSGSDGPIRHVHLFRSDEVMRETNQWDDKQFLACPVDGAFYYRERELVVTDEHALEKELDRFLAQLVWPVQQTEQLELLYEGTKFPEDAAIEQMVQDALNRRQTGSTVYYRVDRTKRVIILQISHES